MIRLTTVFFLIASSVLATLHIIALELFLYWHYEWLDLPMHFLGGSVVALGIFSLRDFRVPLVKRYVSLIPVTLLVIAVALLWEFYEIMIGIPIELNHEFDTSIDLLLGTLGGIVGYVVGESISNLQD